MSALTIHPLGGLGEIGMNCMLLKTDTSMVVVDCGLMFPEDYLYGVDIAIPDFSPILEDKRKLKGIVLTHGHEDHIGALPWLMPFIDCPVYGSPFTLGLVEHKLAERGLARHSELRPVEARQRVELGDLAFNFFAACHSIVDGFALGIETPAGRVVHSGDFKIDRNPMDGIFTDMEGIREFSRPGVELLFSDSTNVERPGFSLTEREIKAGLREVIGQAKARVLVTLFSSHIQRIQEVFDLAESFGRKVGVSGKSLIRNIELAVEHGHLRIPRNTWSSLEELAELPGDQVILLVTGSQGEPLAALSRMSQSDHRQLSIHESDTVIMSSRFIPGNVQAITKVINNLYRLGAEVIYGQASDIHASGHAYRDELRLMFETVRPRHFIPVHGEYRHLVKHSQLAVETGVAQERALVIEDGTPVTFSRGRAVLEEPWGGDKVLVDGKGVGDVGQTVLKDRALLASEGLVIVLIVVDETTGEIAIGPDIISKGFVFEQHYSHLLEDARCMLLDVYEDIQPGNVKKLKERVRSTLRKFFRKVLERDPVVVPLVITI
ncbi:MAG: ribonuclease J [Desulfovibrionaceae bacterium]